MKNHKKELQDYIDKKVKDLRTKAFQYRRLQKLAPKIPAWIFKISALTEANAYNPTQFQFILPWDNSILDGIKQRLTKEGWEKTTDMQGLSSKIRWMDFQKDGLGLNFVGKADIEGATCIISKIGEEKVTSMKPIYEVTCPEGAEEQAFT